MREVIPPPPKFSGAEAVAGGAGPKLGGAEGVAAGGPPKLNAGPPPAVPPVDRPPPKLKMDEFGVAVEVTVLWIPEEKLRLGWAGCWGC